MTTYTMYKEDMRTLDFCEMDKVNGGRKIDSFCGMLSESLLASTIILAKVRGETIVEFAERFGIRSFDDTIQLLYYWFESETCKI